MKKTISVSALLTLMLFAQCSLLNKQEADNKKTALALLLGVTAGCVIGGQTFTPSAGVTCSGGAASGTGTLTATTNKDEVFLQISPFIAGGSSIKMFMYAPTDNVADASAVSVTFASTGMSNDQHFTDAFSTGGSTYCLEFHGEHHHILYKNEACSTAAADEAIFSETSGQQGWGFQLNNATLSNVSFFAEGRLTE